MKTSEPVTDILEATGPVVQVRRGTDGERTDWRLSAEFDPDVLQVHVADGEKREVCFFTGADTLCREVSPGEHHDFVIRFEGTDYPTRIQAIPPAAVFDEAYRAAHRGEISISVPEVYEMVNIAIALTSWSQRDDNYAVRDQGSYYEDVMEHFAPVADHPLVRWLDREMERGMYFQHKMSGYSFVFDDGGRIRRSPVYNSTNFRGRDNSLLPVMEELQSFADASGFRSFYRAHLDHYQEQERFFHDELDVERMLEWLQDNFPDVDFYDHVNVVFSPLVWANQSVTWFDQEGFSELQPHVNFPYPTRVPGYENLTEESDVLRRGATLFTELNHGFINPTAARWRDEIARAMEKREYWVDPERSAGNYTWPQGVFTEMMNWALLSLYYVDEAPARDHEALVSVNADYHQARGRGFIRAPEFHSFLVNLYTNRPPGTTVADLYPRIIDWFAAQNEGD